MNDVKILISSDCNYEKLVAEIYFKDKYIGLLNQDLGENNLLIEFPDNTVNENVVIRTIPYAIFEEALKEARHKLIEK